MRDAPPPDITFDLSCSACGYNLRGLTSFGPCPECGLPTRDSLDDHAARPTWLRTIRRGSMLLGAAMGLGVIAAGMMYVMPSLIFLIPVAAILGVVGTWQFAAPAPAHRGSGTFLRVAGVLTCGMQVQLAFVGKLAAGDTLLWLHYGVMPLLIVWSVAAAATCWRAAGIARELHDTSGTVQGRLLAFIAPAAIFGALVPLTALFAGNISLVPLVAWGVSALVVTGWCAVYFTGFTIVLHRECRLA